MFEGFLWHDEFFIAEALVLFGDWYVVTILRILIPDRLIGVNLSLLPIILLGRRLGGVFVIFGII